MPDIKAIQGDTSDNIPGVRGIGPKHAIRLLTQFGSLEGIYERLEEVTPARFQKALEDARETSPRDKRLTTIARDVPVELDLPLSVVTDYDRNSVVELLRELEFHSVIARLPGDDAAEGQARMFEEDTGPDADYRVVDTEEALAAMVADLDSPSGFSFDTETTSTDPMAADLVGLSFSNAAGVAWYVPVGHREGRQLPQDRVLAALKPLFESEATCRRRLTTPTTTSPCSPTTAYRSATCSSTRCSPRTSPAARPSASRRSRWTSSTSR